MQNLNLSIESGRAVQENVQKIRSELQSVDDIWQILSCEGRSGGSESATAQESSEPG
jgi:hypothetical protein